MCKHSFSEDNPSTLQLNSTLSACGARRALVAKRHNNLKMERENAAVFSLKKSFGLALISFFLVS